MIHVAMATPTVLLARHVERRGIAPVFDQLVNFRPFNGAPRRAAIVYERDPISFTQIFPFVVYAEAIRRDHGVALRFHRLDAVLANRIPRIEADSIFVQYWFRRGRDGLAALLERLHRRNPLAAISYVDAFAHSDIRFARDVEPWCDYYLKKSLFRERRFYFRDWRGDTNLIDFYEELFGIKSDIVRWQTPHSILPKLRLSPNFFTSPRYMFKFLQNPEPPKSERPIDIHARLGTRGPEWYARMRRLCIDRLALLGTRRRIVTGPVAYRTYLSELAASKTCVSPFGYGEICIRDIEAVMSGCAVVKPDMGHLETLPELFEAGVTYFPCKWDFSDLEEVLEMVLADEDLRGEVAAEAYRRVHAYLSQGRFVEDIGPCFAPRESRVVSDPTNLTFGSQGPKG